MATRKDVIFRSITDLKDYNDDTHICEPSMTDPEQDVTIDQLMRKLIKGIPLPEKMVTYDQIGAETPHGEAFDALPAMERDGADISDIQPIVASAEAALGSLPKPPPPPAQPAPEVK